MSTLRFPGVAAVDDVSLELNAGEVVGLLGPNGAGKTTTLRTLAVILTPNAGRVDVCGIDLQADPPGARQRLGFLSGDTRLYQQLTPIEVLRSFGQLSGMGGAPLAPQQPAQALLQRRSAPKRQGFARRPVNVTRRLRRRPLQRRARSSWLA